MTNRQYDICTKIDSKWTLKRILKEFHLEDYNALQDELDDLKLDARCTFDDNDPVFLDTRSQAAFEESRRDRRYRCIPVIISVISVALTIVSALIALGALQLSSIEIFGRPLSFLEILGLFPK